MISASITLTAPTGGAWEFLVLFLVVIVGPPIMQRARIPGLVGLLLGGLVIGPHGLKLIDPGSTTIPDLGSVGLLYLMFVAGVELDLSLLRQLPQLGASRSGCSRSCARRSSESRSGSRSAGRHRPRSCWARCSHRTRWCCIR